MNNILVYSKNLEEHLKLLRQVFQILHDNKFYTKRSKCSFAQSSVDYLVHLVSAEGVATEPSKISVVQNCPTPQNVK